MVHNRLQTIFLFKIDVDDDNDNDDDDGLYWNSALLKLKIVLATFVSKYFAQEISKISQSGHIILWRFLA